MIPVLLQKAVAEHPFLHGMPSTHVQLLAECAMLTQFAAGQVIFREGEIANRFYLVQRGRVSIETPGTTGEWITVQSVGAGDVLGWSWLFAPYYWHFHACALEPTHAIFFYGTRLRECCERDAEFGYGLMRRVSAVLMQRLQATVKESLRLASLTPGRPPQVG